MFFGPYTKALLFIDDDQSKVFELNILGQKSVCADKNVYFSLSYIFESEFCLFGRAKTRDHIDADGKAAKARRKRFKMLHGKDRSRNENSDLFSTINHRFKGGAHSDFSLAISHISAHDSIHRFFR